MWQPIETADTQLSHSKYMDTPCIIGVVKWGNGSKHVGPAIYYEITGWEFIELDDYDMFPAPTHWWPWPEFKGE